VLNLIQNFGLLEDKAEREGFWHYAQESKMAEAIDYQRNRETDRELRVELNAALRDLY
jgi:hypothetical protein